MGFNKPSDIAIIFGIFGLVVVTGLFGIQSVNFYTNQTANEENIKFYTYVNDNITGEDGLKGAADDTTEALTGKEGFSLTELLTDNFVVRGFNSLVNLGKIFTSSNQALEIGAEQLALDPIYITIIVAILLIVFVVVLWTWLTGGGT